MKKLIETKDDFLELFNRISPSSISEDYNGVSCFAPKGVVEKLKKSDNFVSDILAYCSLPDEHTYRSFYDAGFAEFTEFLGIWKYGFRSLEAIDRIMTADKKRYFAKAVYDDGMFADFYNNEYEWKKHSEAYYRENGEIQTCFSFLRKPWLYEQIRILLGNCSETNAGYLVEKFLKHPKKMKHCESSFFKKYKRVYAIEAITETIEKCEKNFVKDIVIPTLLQKGFSKKTFNYIENKIFGDADIWPFPSKKELIYYSKEELNLEWEKDGYKFILPKKVGMIYTLNRKKFNSKNELIDLDVIDKITTQVYVMNGRKYKFLFELSQFKGEDFFTLVEVTLPKSRIPQKITDKEYELIKGWCEQKKIIIDYYNFGLKHLYEAEAQRQFRL